MNSFYRLHFYLITGIFSICNGWGLDISVDCRFKTANVTVTMWTDPIYHKYYEYSEYHSTANQPGYVHNRTLPFAIDLDNDLLSVTVILIYVYLKKNTSSIAFHEAMKRKRLRLITVNQYRYVDGSTPCMPIVDLV